MTIKIIFGFLELFSFGDLPISSGVYTKESLHVQSIVDKASIRSSIFRKFSVSIHKA
jgi:hypothetical protein